MNEYCQRILPLIYGSPHYHTSTAPLDKHIDFHKLSFWLPVMTNDYTFSPLLLLVFLFDINPLLVVTITDNANYIWSPSTFEYQYRGSKCILLWIMN